MKTKLQKILAKPQERQVSFLCLRWTARPPRRVSAMPADRQSHPSPEGWVHPNGGLTRTPTSPGDRTPPPLKTLLDPPKPNTKTITNKQDKNEQYTQRETGKLARTTSAGRRGMLVAALTKEDLAGRETAPVR